MRPAILAVDDDAANRQVIGEIFRRDHMDVRFAESGEQALRLLHEGRERFDVVVLDRMMSGIDGLEVLRRMKAAPELSALPVVMQTAASAPEEVSEGLAAGALYYLTKPYTPDALRTIVLAALSDARGRSELEQHSGDALNVLSPLQQGHFTLRTLEEARALAGLLSHLAAEPKLAVVGLAELFTNAIEHGNLAIDCELKANLIRSERWAAEIQRRYQLPEYRDRRVRIEVSRQGDDLRCEVRDEGAGFDYGKYLELDPLRAFEPNGRGIALARRMCFKTLDYEGSGSIAIATLSAKTGP